MTPAEGIADNFVTGNGGLIAIDKVGNQVLFLRPPYKELFDPRK
jgi:hypothetical protein